MTTRKVAQTVLRWTARTIGALLVGLVVLFAVGEGVRLQDFDAITGSMMVGFLVALAGMLVLWRWELVGGMMVVVGMGGFYAIEYLSSGDLPGGWVLPVCFLPGVLAMASWVVEKTGHGSRLTSSSASSPRPSASASFSAGERTSWPVSVALFVDPSALDQSSTSTGNTCTRR
jgi:hypothetical protein